MRLARGRRHTSNGLAYLRQQVPDYNHVANYINAPAARAAYKEALGLASTDPRFDLETRKSFAKDERTKIEQLKP